MLFYTVYIDFYWINFINFRTVGVIIFLFNLFIDDIFYLWSNRTVTVTTGSTQTLGEPSTVIIKSFSFCLIICSVNPVQTVVEQIGKVGVHAHFTEDLVPKE